MLINDTHKGTILPEKEYLFTAEYKYLSFREVIVIAVIATIITVILTINY